MKRKELLKRWGIVILSAMVMAGTAAAPLHTVYASEAGEGTSGGENGEGGGKSDPGADSQSDPEPEGGQAGNDGSDDGDDNSGTGGGGTPSEPEGGDPGDEGSGQGNSGGTSSGSTTGSSAGSSTGSSSDTEDGDDDGQDPSEGSTDDDPAPEGNTGMTSEVAAEVERAKVGEMDEPEGYSEADNYNGTNEELISRQHIVYDLPRIRKDFRFTTVDKVIAFSSCEMNIYEEQDEESGVVGIIARNGILYELENEDNGWIYVESGNARGFVREEDLIRGEEAEELAECLERQAARISAMLPEGVSRESYFFTAQDTVPYYENEAYAFRRITTQDIVIEGEAALAGSDMGIMEECSEDARTVGSLKEGDLVYIIEEADEGWLFVESGDVRGFIPSEGLDRSNAVRAQIEEEGESSLSTAREVIVPSENKAVYYSLLSVREGAKYNEIREKIVEKALSCVGNPYVWGGTSLTRGADCSGFVQTLYKMFGYSLPRVAAAQSGVGTQIPVSDAAPGDLIFFARNGYIYHVAMYAGDGKTVEAYSTQYGIITKELTERNAVWATRIIED